MVSSNSEGGIAGRASMAGRASTAFTPPPYQQVKITRGKYAGCIGIKPPHPLDPAFAFLPPGREDVQQANADLFTAAPALHAALTKIAYGHFGDPEATHAQVLDDITHYARRVLNGGEA